MKFWFWLKVIVIAAVVVMILSSMANISSPRKTLDEFVSAFNKMDVEALLDCVEPSKARPLQSMLALASGLLGVQVNDVVGALPLLSDFAGMSFTQPRLSYELVTEWPMREEDGIEWCRLTVRMTLTDQRNSQTSTEDVYFVRQGGKWYLAAN